MRANRILAALVLSFVFWATCSRVQKREIEEKRAHCTREVSYPRVGHAVIDRESKTNYGCAAIIWDRVFGTYERADTVNLGDFAVEPSFLRKLALPFLRG